MKPSTRNTSHLFRARNLAGPLAAISLASTMAANAALLITRAEGVATYTTTVEETSVLSFDESTFAVNTTYSNYNWTNGSTAIGTIDQLRILAADNFGGAGASGSRYSVQSTRTNLAYGVTTSTLTLSEPNAYFGFWWSAGDAFNKLTFKNGNTIVAEFTTNLLSSLPSTYNGLPRNKSINTGEKYAFINFFGTSGTTWDKIEFSNLNNTTGFESDNWTVRKDAWGQGPEGPTAPIPGIVVTTIPEPSSLLAALASVGLLVLRRKR